MNIKEKFQKIWDILQDKEEDTQKFEDENKEETDEAFVDVKTEDGRIMRVADISVDQPVQEVTEDGLVEVADGTYVLETGTSIVVVEGVISEVVEAEMEETEEEMEEKEEKEEDKEVELEKDETLELLTNIAERLTTIESKFKTQEAAFEEFKKESAETHTDTRVRFKNTEEKKKPVSKLHQVTGRV